MCNIQVNQLPNIYVKQKSQTPIQKNQKNYRQNQKNNPPPPTLPTPHKTNNRKQPQLDKTTQGIKNRNLSKTKLCDANKIETQPTNTQATKKFETPDLNPPKPENRQQTKQSKAHWQKPHPKQNPHYSATHSKENQHQENPT